MPRAETFIHVEGLQLNPPGMGSVTGSVLGSTSGSTPGSTSGSTPGSTSGSTPGSTPGSIPGSTPGSTPGSRSTPRASKARILHDVGLTLPLGARCVLVGPNGCGKSSLLRVLAGKQYIGRHGAAYARIATAFARPIYHDPLLTPALTYVAERWASKADLSVRELVASEILSYAQTSPALHAKPWALVGLDEETMPRLTDERVRRLLRALQVSLSWRYPYLSLGQQRRVQLLKGLLIPRPALLLDEATTQLDPLARKSFLEFLANENETYGLSIILATHLFHGLDHWATHLACLSFDGATLNVFSVADLLASRSLHVQLMYNPFFTLLESWLVKQWDLYIQALAENPQENEREARFRGGSSSIDWQYLTGGSRSENLPGERNAPEVVRFKEELTRRVRIEANERLAQKASASVSASVAAASLSLSS